MAKIKLDLHTIFNRGREIDSEVIRVVEEAVEKRIQFVEIIVGKGSGQLKKNVLKLLAKANMKNLYFRIEKDDKNTGRFFIRFRHKSPKAFHN